MRRIATLALAVPALVLGAAASAAAQTATFNEYQSPVTTEFQATIGAPVVSGAFAFYNAEALGWTGARNALGTWGSSPADPGFVNNPVNLGSSNTMFGTSLGAAGAVDMYAASYNLVTGTGLQSFGLYSIDISHLYSSIYFGGAPLFGFSITFSAASIDGGVQSTFSQTFNVAAPTAVGGVQTPVLTTLVFDNRFRSVYNVWWTQGTGEQTAHQFTNVNATVIPEPSTYLLMATGLVVLALVARRRRGAIAAV